MDFKSKIGGFATHEVINRIPDLLGRISDENLVRLTYLGEKLTSDDEVLSGIAGVRRYFHLNAKGDVEPCVYIHVAVDNIRSTTLAQVLDNRLFRSIRARQPHNPNHLRPCMIIDNPHVMRELIKETKPYFTHPGAEEIYTTRSHQKDAYAKHFAELADPVWHNEYTKGKDKRITWPSVSQIVLGFVYPDDRKILEMIASYRRLALMDHSLIGNLPHPLARGVIINNIPVNLLKVFEIGFCHEKNLVQ